ncbi:MAG: hypothetical protein U0575_11400 [Phycisphaerales bacterium]
MSAATTIATTLAAATAGSPARRRFNPFRALLDLFSSVPFGIVLLTLLFLYCTIGSAGVIYPIHPNVFDADHWVHAQLRTWRPFELTEFEWFHWWPFNLLILLICLNVAITTVRRIRLSVVNLGVWMIHTGIIILAIGSVIYFSRKVEGDAPVVRRQIVAEIDTPAGPVRTSLLAMPGAVAELDTPDGPWRLEVAQIDPAWEIRSGSDVGKMAYSVNVVVTSPIGATAPSDTAGSNAPASDPSKRPQRFMRQLLADHPEYTEDVLFTDNPQQPMQRAVKATGKPLVADALRLALDYEPARWFYLKNDADKSWALYVRRPGEQEWHERRIEGLPLYNDYIASRDDVIQPPGETPLPLDPIDVAIPATSPDDPFKDVTFRATGYLRYAMTRTQFADGGPQAALNPAVWLSVGFDEKQKHDLELFAFDPARRRADQGIIAFRWVRSAEELQALLKPPTLDFDVPSSSGGARIRFSAPITDLARVNPSLAFAPIEGSDYSWRVFNVEDDIGLSSGSASVAIVELKSSRPETPAAANGAPATAAGDGGRVVRRWVFDDPALTRDVPEGAVAPTVGASTLVDDRVEIRYRPGAGRAVLTIVAGPDERDLGMVVAASNQQARVVPLRVDQPTTIGGGLSLVVTDYFPRAISITKPLVVPREQRMRDAAEFFAQARIEVDGQSGHSVRFSGGTPWLAFHRYVFSGPERVLRRQVFEPTLVTLADGREIEVLFSRQRLPLPAPVALDDFRLTTHIGGFTGEASTIRNYTSFVRFDENTADDAPSAPLDPRWGAPVALSVNEPISRDGWWFFQAQWDPPDEARAAGQRASAGLNYTVLGVGNRDGVWVQLAGCIVAVSGMIYAFYVKPLIKRRRQLAVQRQVEAMAARGELPAGARVRPLGSATLVGAADGRQ